MKKQKRGVKPLPITEKDFIRIMTELKSIMDAGWEINDAMKKLSPDFGGFFNERAETIVVDLLKTITKDDCDNIGYYIYELEWGKDWKKGMITDADGSDIKMKTLSDLYVQLQENYI